MHPHAHTVYNTAITAACASAQQRKDVVGMNPKWVVISIAHSDNSATTMSELLSREGFMCRVNLMAGDSCYEVMTLSTEAQEARDFLHENGY